MAYIQYWLNAIWSLFNITFYIDSYRLKFWYFIAFPVVLAITYKTLKGGGQKND